jgi:hypothetical protein
VLRFVPQASLGLLRCADAIVGDCLAVLHRLFY